MKWKQELEKFGFNESNISQGLKNKIRDIKDVQKALAEMEETLQNPSVNDDIEELKEGIEGAKEDLETLDEELVKAIQKFEKNKDHYANLTQKMKEGRAKKKGGNAQTQEQTQAQQQVQTNEQNLPITPTEEVKPEEKKKTSWGWVAFAIIGGIVTLGAVNLLKNKD